MSRSSPAPPRSALSPAFPISVSSKAEPTTILDPRQRVRPAPAGRLRAAHPEIDAHGCRRVGIGRRHRDRCRRSACRCRPRRRAVIAAPPSSRSSPPSPRSVSLPPPPLRSSCLAVPVRLSSLSPPAKSDATDSVPSANCSVSTAFTWFTLTPDVRAKVCVAASYVMV